MKPWTYTIEKDAVIAIGFNFECEANAKKAAEERKASDFPKEQELRVRTFQFPYEPYLNWEETEKKLRTMVSDLIKWTQCFEKTCEELILFLNSLGVDIGDPQFNTLNEIQDGAKNVDALIYRLLTPEDRDED